MKIQTENSLKRGGMQEIPVKMTENDGYGKVNEGGWLSARVFLVLFFYMYFFTNFKQRVAHLKMHSFIVSFAPDTTCYSSYEVLLQGRARDVIGFEAGMWRIFLREEGTHFI